MRDYQDAIATMFERSATDALVTLREPVCERPAAARRIVGLLVETIAGYAIGCVGRELVRACSAWFGPEIAAIVRTATPPPRRVRRPSTDEGLDADLRPLDLIDELRGCLRARLALAVDEARMLIEVGAGLLPPDSERSRAAMFAELARKTVFDDRLALEIALGWQCACAAIERAPMPDVDCPPRARDLWQMWSRLVGNSPPSETRQPDRDSYITVVR
jgi:hypothetical protein